MVGEAEAGSAPKEHSLLLRYWSEHESESLRLWFEPGFGPLPVFLFGFGKDSIVIRFPRDQGMENNASLPRRLMLIVKRRYAVRCSGTFYSCLLKLKAVPSRFHKAPFNLKFCNVRCLKFGVHSNFDGCGSLWNYDHLRTHQIGRDWLDLSM